MKLNFMLSKFKNVTHIQQSHSQTITKSPTFLTFLPIQIQQKNKIIKIIFDACKLVRQLRECVSMAHVEISNVTS
jgi:phosphorylcholine metabolism protein LicD